jgi:hypothetical protein
MSDDKKPPLPITREVVNDCISAGVNATYWTNTHVLALLDRIDELERLSGEWQEGARQQSGQIAQLDRALAEARIDLAAVMKSRDAAHAEATKAFKANDDLKKDLAYYKKTAEDQAAVLRRGAPKEEESEVERKAWELFLVFAERDNGYTNEIKYNAALTIAAIIIKARNAKRKEEAEEKKSP